MRNKEKKQEKNRLNKILLVVSIMLLIISILLKNSTPIRPILWLLSIIIFGINLKINKIYPIPKIIIISLISLAISLVVDGIIVYTFNKIPIFSYNIIKKGNTIVYNSLGMRVWQCNISDFENIIVDPFYKKGYMCDAKDIETIDINTFLNTVVQNHNEYKNNYVKIKGKISKKSGINLIEMRPYTQTETKVNGQVEFANNITLKVMFKENNLDLDSYDVYDEITIIGIVKNMETIQNNHIIYISDSILVGSINLEEYSLMITKEKKCSKEPTLIYNNNDYNLYKYCLTEILITYPDGQYELPMALSSNKLSIESLYMNYTQKEENEYSVIYRFVDYSVLVCNDNKEIFIGNAKMKFDNIKCNKEITE